MATPRPVIYHIYCFWRENWLRHVDSQHSLRFTRIATVAAVLCLPLFARPALAQIATTGMISGTVSDPTGSAIAGAQVTITNTATGAALETVSNSTGSFTQVGLTAGQYEVAVSHPGFTTFRETGIALESVGEYAVTAVLKVGAESSAVTVSAGATAVQTTTPEISSIVSAEETEALPLNGRNYQGLGSLMPGVVNNSPVAGLGTGGFNTANAINVNGQGLGGSLYLLDGVWNTSSTNHNQTNIMPSTPLWAAASSWCRPRAAPTISTAAFGSSFATPPSMTATTSAPPFLPSIRTSSDGKWADLFSSRVSTPGTTTKRSFITTSRSSDSNRSQ